MGRNVTRCVTDDQKEHFLDLSGIKDLTNLVTAEYKFYEVPAVVAVPQKNSLRLGISWITGVIILS